MIYFSEVIIYWKINLNELGTPITVSRKNIRKRAFNITVIEL